MFHLPSHFNDYFELVYNKPLLYKGMDIDFVNAMIMFFKQKKFDLATVEFLWSIESFYLEKFDSYENLQTDSELNNSLCGLKSQDSDFAIIQIHFETVKMIIGINDQMPKKVLMHNGPFLTNFCQKAKLLNADILVEYLSDIKSILPRLGFEILHDEMFVIDAILNDTAKWKFEK